MSIFGGMKKIRLINRLFSSFRSITISPLCKIKSECGVSSQHSKSIKSNNDNSAQNFLNINQQLISKQENRLFAVVQLCGKQFKITQGDIILVEGHWPPSIGDAISLDKVLLAGSNDFTLIGCPILRPGICDVSATVIEKTITHTKTHFRKKRRKQYMRINFYRSPNTMIRINSINMNKLNDDGASGSDTRMF